MKLDARDLMGHSRLLCWTTYRDDLPDLAEHLPNIDRIEVLEREEPEEGVVRLVNRWHAEGDIPAVARRFIKPEMVNWTERVTWDQSTWVCSWEIEPAFFTSYVTVKGATDYNEAGEGRCEIHIQGDLSVDVRGMRGVPRLLGGQVNKAVEKFIGALILPNMRRLNRSVGKALDLRR
jgi:hypothetical protein